MPQECRCALCGSRSVGFIYKLDSGRNYRCLACLEKHHPLILLERLVIG